MSARRGGLALCVLAWLLAAASCPAAEFYVTPSGAGLINGTDWDNAFSNAQAAIDLAAGGSDTIYLQAGIWSNASPLLISSNPGVTLRGGCWGLLGGSSNAYCGTNSTLTRSGGAMRIVYAGDSTVTVAGVTIQGGLLNSGASNGAGVYFTNCAVTLSNCVVRDNTNTCTTGPAYGGGVYAAGGSLTVVNGIFQNNALRNTGQANYGAGLAAVGCAVNVYGTNTVFSNNTVSGSGSPYGGAIYVTNGALTLEDATLVGNWLSDGWSTPGGGGGAVCHEGSGKAATITGCRFETNSVKNGGYQSSAAGGGAIYLGGATGVIENCVFANNSTTPDHQDARPKGGAIFARNLQSLEVISSEFRDNQGSKGGGTLYLMSCSNMVMDGCTMDAGGISAGKAPELVYVSGSGSAWFLNSTLRNNNAGHGINVAGSAGSIVALTNCLLAGHSGNGLNYLGATNSTLALTNCLVLENKANGLAFSKGNAALFNCLLALNTKDGMVWSAGTVTVANCTLADNGGWGLNRSGGGGTVLNSIAWGNAAGGILSNESLWVDYSCLPAPAYGGANNLTNDPLFANVPDCYYLSSNGLAGQAVSSPCIDAGSDAAEALGLNTRTTCTSGTNDTDIVDLGYHYAEGSEWVLTNTTVYVDAVNGSNVWDGLSWASAWQTLTHALSNVAANATIHVGTGRYDAASGEAFPLVVRMPNLTLAATNTDPALTVVDNGRTNGQRILQAIGKGAVFLQGLTFQGGRFDTGENYGAGLLFQGCAVTLSNCVVRDNTNTCTTGPAYGGGVYAAGGSLTVVDSVFQNNALRNTGQANYGAGLAAVGCAVNVYGTNTVFSNNTVLGSGSPYGGAIYVSNGALTLEDATLVGNWLSDEWTTPGGGGGAVCHEGSGKGATITGCRFETNSVKNGGYQSSAAGGGAIYLGGATGVIENCVFANNSTTPNHKDSQPKGGAIFAKNLQSLEVISSEFWDNQGSKGGGTLYLSDCSNVVVNACVLDANGVAAGRAPQLVYITGGGIARFLKSVLNNNQAGGALYYSAISSELGLTNCVLADNEGYGVYLNAGSASLLNCTFAHNAGWGIARPTSAALAVRGSIFWGNGIGGIGHNHNLTMAYSDAQDFWAPGMGAGNFSADPLFVNPAAGDFHLQSTAGSWHDGAWTPDARLSPCIDAGDPASDWSLEPKPSGGRVNLGAYGNTPEASKSVRGTVFWAR